VSSDGGAVWTSLDTFLYEGGCCLVVPESTHIIIAGGNTGVLPDPLVICVSRDSGRNWIRHVLSEEFGMARTLATSQGRIYCCGQVGSAGAVFISDDYGASWKRSTAPPSRSVRSIAVSPDDPGRAHAAASDGVYFTSDAGETWTRLHAADGLRSVRFFPGCPDTLFVAGSTGVLMSPNRGSTWQDWNDGLTNTDVTTLEFADAGGIRLIAGTMGDACYQWSFPTGLMEQTSAVDDVRLAIHPNPVRTGHATVHLHRQLPASPPPLLGIYDASGRLVRQSSLGLRASSMPLDLRSMRAGVYLVRLTAGTFSTTQKLVIQR